MSPDPIVAECEVAGGTHLTLYANRMELHGGDAMEIVPLAHLASVRVAFERDPRKLNWAIGLLATALVLASLSSPLRNWMAELAAKVSAGGGRESLDSVLIAAFTALGNLARLLSPVAAFLAAAGVALLVLFWLGRTSLTLAFAATERSCSVRGRDSRLAEFAELVGEQLSARKG